MGDLTGEYFARVMFLKGYKWLSKFENIDSKIIKYVVAEQKRKIKVMKEKFNKIRLE